MKKKTIKTTTIILAICTVLYLPILSIGYVLYLLSKITRSLGQLLMLNKGSARDELAGFWLVYTSLGDAFNNSRKN